ncbi:MAG: MATE family efflux transporter [Eubacteriales bacterium]|nr:MATE family efflux transporter [Lachnospiraceae bacterium]MDO5126353.1 MATE family efflux transporter [Eubacteriales bacterium]
MDTLQLKNEKKEFYQKIFKLVLPMIIQNILSAAISSADVIMLNYTGQDSISAVSLASQYASILFSVFYGLSTGVTMLCSQYFGKGDFHAIQVIEGIALRFSMSSGIFFATLALFIPDKLMHIFTNNTSLISIGASYIRCMSVAYLCWGIIEVYLSILRSCNRVAICTVLSSMAFILNVILNAVFIFGLFGAPKLGATGVAIATSASRLAELLGCMIVSARSNQVKLKLRYMFIRNKALFSDFIRLSLPALLNDIVWGVAFSMYSVIIGHMGSDAVAANSFVVVVRNFGTIFCYGIASAGTILLGNVLGEGKLRQAKDDGKRLMKLTVISGILGGLVVLAIIPIVMRFASNSLSDTALHYLKYMLLINTYYITGTAVNTTLIAGVFRAGGDSRFGFICDTIDMWCYAVPLGFISAFVLKLPVLVVYFLLCTDEFVKWPWVLKHYRSGKWVQNITRDNLF